MKIEYVVGDATHPKGDGAKVIVHICNDSGFWGKGFVLALSKRWSAPEAAFRQWHIGQHKISRRGSGPPIRYTAVQAGLEKVAKFCKEQGASVHMPRIGCGLAGGRWEEIAPIIEEALIAKGVPVTVYDF